MTVAVKPATRLLPHKAVYPTLASQCFVAPTASVIGDVELGKGVSIWYGAVVRGDVHHIRVSEHERSLSRVFTAYTAVHHAPSL